PVSQSVTLSHTLFVPTTMLSWSGSSSPIWFLMPHVLDLAFWLAEAEPVSGYARGRRGVLAARGIDTWDLVHTSIGLS
ncbi:gfo/Idh/MocA family oxidoreductase, partial [Bacillus cereus]|nr:gfo/Idh/MocA family oxidoreductase [Bacillus cereus]